MILFVCGAVGRRTCYFGKYSIGPGMTMIDIISKNLLLILFVLVASGPVQYFISRNNKMSDALLLCSQPVVAVTWHTYIFYFYLTQIQ